ncbi:MAG: hypothetical protein DRJ06_07700 [Candidatus Aminicenantes bacterium]|nr:MAG: hypothetical protein DRJ06_07700 [Candidatus Aminicenantes bacterium]
MKNLTEEVNKESRLNLSESRGREAPHTGLRVPLSWEIGLSLLWRPDLQLAPLIETCQLERLFFVKLLNNYILFK